MKGRLRIFLLSTLLGACLVACEDGPQAGVDGKTSWLGACHDNSECKPGLECKCGFCTRSCSETSDCASLSSHAQCAEPSALSQMCTDLRPPERICTAPCGENQVCGAPDAASDAKSSAEAGAGGRGGTSDGASGAGGGAEAGGSSRNGGDRSRDAGSVTEPIDASNVVHPDSGRPATPTEGSIVPCADDDGDQVCNAVDACPGSDDHVDSDSDGRPDGCEPMLLLDINTDTISSSPAYFTELGSDVYFSAVTRQLSPPGRLMKIHSDGSEPADIDDLLSSVEPAHLATAGGKLFFVRNHDGVFGQASVWVSDGTPQGPVRLKSAIPGVVLDAKGTESLYYFVIDHDPEMQLWRSDGTASGTLQLAATIPPLNEQRDKLVAMRNLMFFTDAGQLIRSDGTTAGTFPLTPTGGMFRATMGVLHDRLYFIATDGNVDNPTRSVWSTDGTIAGTRPAFVATSATFFPYDVSTSSSGIFVSSRVDLNDVATIWASAGEGHPPVLASASGPVQTGGAAAYAFEADSSKKNLRVWQIDPAGNTALVDTVEGHYFLSVSAATGAYLLVQPDNASPVDLYRVDATGVVRLSAGAFGSSPIEAAYFVSGDRVLFAGCTPERGCEPWATDGTPAGTHELVDLATGTGSSDPSNFLGPLGVASPVIFSAWSPSTGNEPWTTSGEAKSTRLLVDTDSGAASGFEASWASVHGFSMFLAHGKVYRVDAGDRVDVVPDSPWGPLSYGRALVAGDELLFSSDHGPFRMAIAELESAVATNQTTAPLFTSELPLNALTWNGKNWLATGESPLIHIWRDDEMVGNAISSTMVALDDGVYFAGSEYPNDIFRAGTTGAPVRVTDLFAEGIASQGGELSLFDASLGQHAYFTAGTPGSYRLYRTISQGLELAADVEPSGEPLVKPLVLGDRMFILDGNGGLWVSDGTPAGTHHLSDAASSASLLTAYRGLVYFVGVDSQHGQELWRTDGTEAGTFMESDINPGPASSYPSNLYATESALYLTAMTEKFGHEAWVMHH